MLRIIFSCLFALLVAGCGGPRYVDYFPYHDDGTAKPRVALIPTVDASKSQIPWNVSDELTQGLQYNFMQDGDLYLLSAQEMGPGVKKLDDAELFGPDLSFAKHIRDADFVVITELVQHEVLPFEKGKFYPLYAGKGTLCNFVLAMKVRLRIIDVRYEKPAIVLQELFVSNHMVPKAHDDVDYSKMGWGMDGYKQTPYGSSHSRLIRDLSARIEEVVWGAR